MAAIALALVAGCGEKRPSLPSACRQGQEAVERALSAAPAPVRIDGVPISRCMTDGADGADLQQLGAAVNGAAAHLVEAARRRPQSPQALQLGYLSGAIRRGAQRTQGLHRQLVRRIDQELVRVDTSSPAFRRGERAGGETG